MPVRRGLQVLLPIDFAPRVVRLIGRFAGSDVDDEALLGRCVRLSLHHLSSRLDAVLHDCYVLFEGTHGIVVHVAPGASLQIPRGDIGGMRWALEPDSNPHSAAQISAAWVSAATENRRCEPLGSIEVHLGCETAGSCHRRIRGLGLNESVQHPSRPPFFVYGKFFFPYMHLTRGEAATSGEAYMREAAAYRILHLCRPAVAPLMHHASFHEETGSYCCVLDDLAALLDLNASSKNASTSEQLMAQLFRALAVLHGRFLTEPQPGSDESSTPPPPPKFNKDLLQAMVHPKLFYAAWREAIGTGEEDGAALGLLDEIYGVAPPAAAVTAQEAECSGAPAVVALRGRRAVGDACRTIAASPGSLTLIHGNLRPEHLKLTKDRRASPNIYLLDWKRSGIGPLEVDLLQAYLLIPVDTRKASPDLLLRLLHEYTTSMDIFYGHLRTIVDLLQCMRDVCYVLACTGPFDWNHDGAIAAESWLSLHTELCDRTTDAQITILEERLETLF